MRAARRILAVGLGSALGLGLAEVAVRGLDLRPTTWGRHVHLETADKRGAVDLYPDDPWGELPLDLRAPADRLAVEAMGLEVPEEQVARTPHGVTGRFDAGLCREDREPAPVDVLVVGDSFTEGQGVTREQAWPARLEAHSGRRVLNCGRRGYDVEDVAGFLERQLHRAPRLVLYGMLLNDVLTSADYPAQEYLDDWIVVRRRMEPPDRGGSALLRLGTDLLETRRVSLATRHWYAGLLSHRNDTGWRRTVETIVAMDTQVRARNADFAVVLWPILSGLDDYPFLPVHKGVQADLGAVGIRVLDLSTALSGESAELLWVHPADHHPNRLAHDRAGGAVGRWLQATH